MKHRSGGFVGLVVAGVAIAACGSGPSKSEALTQIQASVKEDGSCTLPIDIVSKLKVQYVSKGICIPKSADAAKAKACVEALVKAGATHKMPDEYMVAWPDEVAGVSLKDVAAYDRRPRNELFSLCVELTGNLRVGMFTCSEARAEKILKVTSDDGKVAKVQYERAIGLRPTLPIIEAACGKVTPPPSDATATFVKEGSAWKLKPAEEPAAP
ncbi:MAG: hypothetical protein JST00_40145 [Deltaproteobacteria bacterium]|nr:hypothetical protein [Deltaproteobacteria bacterium]